VPYFPFPKSVTANDNCDLKGAHAIIDRMPADCGLCLCVRGRIAALEKNWSQAQYWFARAARDAPSVPFPFTDWGRMLLDKPRNHSVF
jgi:hypothetical protein